MRTFLLILLLMIGSAGVADAALSFPTLSGRVVDDAHILSPTTIQSLDQILGDYERGTSNQIVVVTLPSLQGTTIEDYGYQLGRFWQVGQKGKNNGALLIVAPQERKVRIEVGYGLEPLLTDAASSEIVNEVILPDFRAGRLELGVTDGTKAILAVLGGEGISAASSESSMSLGQCFLSLVFVALFLWFAIRHPFIALLLLSNNSSRFGGSSGGDSFSGGGGSFGGGGASGSW